MAEATQTDAGAAAPPIMEPPPSDGHSPNGAGGPQQGRLPSRIGGRNVRAVVIPIVVVVVLAASLFGFNAYLNSLWYVSTDNAQVAGTPVPVGPLNAGRVEVINVQVGSSVQKGDILAQVALGSSAVREDVRAPFDGIVIDVPVGIGATVSPGQGVVTLVDPSTVYVNANIDETQVARVAPGQRVDVHLDALNATIPGQVDSITPASAGTFSLLPQNNSSGTFTKVTQLVPVKIDVDAASQPLPVGTSAEVKIHVSNH